MGRKAYVADLEAASNSRCHGFQPGSDGEFTFLYTNSMVNIRVNALISDTSDYPKSHQCMLFLNDDAPSSVSKQLASCPSTDGLDIQQIMHTVTEYLRSASSRHHEDQARTESLDDVEEDIEPPESEGTMDVDSEDEWCFDDMMDAHHRPIDQGTTAEKSTAAVSPKRLLEDFAAVKRAGFKVGAYGDNAQTHGRYFSLACRISRLGISEEAMQAWQVQPSHYLVLLLYYPYGYKSWDDLDRMDVNTAKQYLSVRVGQCASYKPDGLELVRKAFSRHQDEEVTSNGPSPTTGDDDRALRDTLTSKPLNELLNTRLITLIRVRIARGFGWSAAEAFFNDSQGTGTSSVGHEDDSYRRLDHDQHKHLTRFTKEDAVVTPSLLRHLSLPLIAMQYTLRHFVRCPEFCQVCYTKVDNDIDAIKPYVCDNPLCLYQYMNLGFGPSIEHEIISQPYVVDLLLSFCYRGAVHRAMRSYPKGLGWSVPAFSDHTNHEADTIARLQAIDNSEAKDSPKQGTQGKREPHSGVIDRRDMHLYVGRFASKDEKALSAAVRPNHVRPGDWIVVRDVDDSTHPVWHCRVLERCSSSLSLSSPIVQRSPSYTSSAADDAIERSNYPDKAKVAFWVYDISFDSLTEHEMARTIVSLLLVLPGVSEMREYLTSHPGTALSKWTSRLPPAVSGLLRWIIASNRSCVFQVDEAPAKTVKPSDQQPHTVRLSEERVRGMSGWLQFRFAMGAPDKEQRFVKAVKAHSTSIQYPTIFAWHGSPIHNWHSIVRHGLDCQTVANGRAFGNGVYHARDLATSSGYSSREGYATWPGSALKITSAVALSEIVNAPSKFTSQSPYYVVQHTDWIQTRYLFVKSTKAISTAEDTELSAALPQDPACKLTGYTSGQKVELPLTAISRSRRPGPDPVQRSESKKGKPVYHEKSQEIIDLTTPDHSDNESITTLDEDVAFLTEPRSAEPAPVARPSDPVTSFTVKVLENLPLLTCPQYATSSASKRLQKDLMTLRNTQDQALHNGTLSSLGWYLDPDHLAKTDNLYQWIISLHSFPLDIPLGQDMKANDIESIVLEIRFAATYPMSPPFVRVIRPRFLPFHAGGGGHITLGGSICMDLLTNSGWTAVSDLEGVLLQIRMALMSQEPKPARLEASALKGRSPYTHRDYHVGEAVEAFIRACNAHGWRIPEDLQKIAAMRGVPT
ncbi:MAG: hypothetical protein M1828_005213 [Chrysothrix sp. TS-e1954]|nr:MAG: hypothetical protein M1828_005213 [Chrysothrix sp. TS-e1954]